MKLTLEKTIILFFVLAVIALMSALLVFDINNQKVKETSDLVEKTQSALNSSDKILLDVFDIVSSTRGYVLTGNEFFLEPYNKSIHTINRNIADLETILKDSPVQQGRIDSLKKLIASRLENSKNLIEVRKRSGFKDAEKIVASLQGKVLSEKIRKIISDINSEELLILEQRKSENKKFFSNVSFVFIVILVALTLALGFILIINNQKKRNRIEEDLKQSEINLQAIFENTDTGFLLMDTELNIISFNSRGDELAKFAFGQNLQKDGNLMKMLPPPRQKPMVDQLNKMLKGETTIYEVPYPQCDGSEIWFSLTGKPIYDNKNSVTGISYSINDISLRKKEEAESQIIELKLKEAQKLAKVGSFDINLITGISIWSEEFYHILGLDKNIVIPSTALFLSTIHPEDSKYVNEQVQEEFDTLKGKKFQCRIKRNDGTIVYITTQSTFEFDEQGKPVRLFGIIKDITEIKISEEALKLSEEKFRQLINLAPVGIALSSLKGEVLEVNQTMINMFGLTSKKEFINTPAEEFYIDKEGRAALIDLLKKNGFVKDFEIRMKGQNSKPIWVCTNLIPFKLANGEGGILSATVNITEQKKQKEEIIQFTNHLEQKIKERTVEFSKAVEVLKQKEEQLEETSSLAKVGGWEIDLSTMVVRWTDEVFRIHEMEPGRTPPVAEGINYYAPEARPVIQEAVNKAIATGEGWDLELPFITAKGNHLWVRAKGNAEMTNGKAIRVYGVFQDITERKNAKQKLIEQNTELKKAEEDIRMLNEGLEQRVMERTLALEAVNKELESFSYSVSHDLRAPLRAIHGYSTILQEDYAAKMDNDGLMALNSIRQNSKRMGGLIDDLLAFSRLGRKEISVSEINMTALVKSIIEEDTDLNSSKINFTIHNLAPATGDQSLIKQVWINLISNAFKYSKQKTKTTIEIGSSIKNNFIEYYIKDNGAGFDMQYYNKLFGVFQRLHSQEEFEGTGIGLAIVQKIICRHKGTVWADSKVDEGAVFYFSLPVS